MRFKKLITPLLITVIICATLALGYQQDPLRRGLQNPFSGAGQTQKKDDQSAEVRSEERRIGKLESKVSLLDMRIEEYQIFAATPCATLRENSCERGPYFQKPRGIPYQQVPLRFRNPFSGAGQILKKDYQSADVKELYSRITNLESKVYGLGMRILPNRLPNPFSGAGQTQKKDDQSAEV